MEQTLDQLISMRGLLAKGWTQHAFARNAAGYPVAPRDPEAACFCFFGAVTAVGCENPAPIVAAVRAYGGITEAIQYWNDRTWRTREEVLAAIDAAIVGLKSEEAAEAQKDAARINALHHLDIVQDAPVFSTVGDRPKGGRKGGHK